MDLIVKPIIEKEFGWGEALLVYPASFSWDSSAHVSEVQKMVLEMGYTPGHRWCPVNAALYDPEISQQTVAGWILDNPEPDCPPDLEVSDEIEFIPPHQAYLMFEDDRRYHLY